MKRTPFWKAWNSELLFVHQMRESSPRNVITPPTPDHLCSIQHVCKCKERYHPPPAPDHLRSIQHVCKCKERYHLYHPPPPQTTCVASNMCAGARNVIIPPPTPDHLRSIQHVCKCKERYHPPPPQTTCVASNMCASARNVIIPPIPKCNKTRWNVKPRCFLWGVPFIVVILHNLCTQNQ